MGMIQTDGSEWLLTVDPQNAVQILEAPHVQQDIKKDLCACLAAAYKPPGLYLVIAGQWPAPRIRRALPLYQTRAGFFRNLLNLFNLLR